MVPITPLIPLVLFTAAAFGYVVVLAKTQEANMALPASLSQLPVPPQYQAAWDDEKDLMTPSEGVALILEDIIVDNARHASGK